MKRPMKRPIELPSKGVEDKNSYMVTFSRSGRSRSKPISKEWLRKNTDKDGKVLYGYVFACDNFKPHSYYHLPASLEAEFKTWAAKGINDGEFDDYLPQGAMTKLIFSRSFVN